jgi:hypothetical protein
MDKNVIIVSYFIFEGFNANINSNFSKCDLLSIIKLAKFQLTKFQILRVMRKKQNANLTQKF